MQIDNGPAPTEIQLWNWQKNIEGGRNRLNVALGNAMEYLTRWNTTPDEKILLIDAYQNYNNGLHIYKGYDSEQKEWILIPGRTEKFYGFVVYNIYKTL